MAYTQSSTEIESSIYRLSIAPSPHFEFAQFLLDDDRPCLVHAGKISLFEPLEAMVSEILGQRSLQYIVFSHVEADESGAVNQWLKRYPEAQVVCNKVANISLEDTLVRPARIIKHGEVLDLGAKSLTMIETPHFPHNWDAHMWFEQKSGLLFCSDCCCQGGICPPVVEHDIADTVIDFYSKGAFIPYGKNTNDHLEQIAKMPFRGLVPMHGSAILGPVSRTVFEQVQTDLINKGKVS